VKIINLGNILTEKQCQEILSIAVKCRTLDCICKELKMYLGQHRELLAKHEIDADYLAYYLAARFEQKVDRSNN